MDTNKRFNDRHSTLGLMSSVSDGKHSFMGIVEDVSTTGLRLSQIPADFDDKVDHCFTVVKGPVHDIKVILRPCWTRATNHGMYKDIGFQVEDPPPSWNRFVERLTNESDLLHTLVAASSEVEM